eukprot:CAMPEP_0178896542 /NCGR_PEP_ID=MMETSP0786-20121207/1237_1 /TAXON_ID=186022 /ORGANISM="Thalassionema frauenfeldii, Strain CCMP 1798" /LENGTH=682 /DNA_ID=CAMNT_0020566969 /DNA_START=463 /DNA_END=2511 /DNA_ORIENTATION=+
MTMGQYQCQSVVGFWPMSISIILALLPYAIAYLLNVRPKYELGQLPDIIDEREQLKSAFCIFTRILVTSTPIIVLTYNNSPAARIYATICAVQGLPLALCYHIAYVKLTSTSTKLNLSMSGSSSLGEGDENGRRSAFLSVRLAEMYSEIGRLEQTVELVEETLAVFKKGNSGTLNLQNEGRTEVALGFTMNDLRDLDGDELKMIIQLLRLKGNALIQLKGPLGFSMSAKLNIDALKIFENCPAASKMKDHSIIFPIYNIVGLQIKGGLIDQDDECSLERDLAERFNHEAQLQAYHYARSLASVAEMYGRIGLYDEAFRHFDIMKAIYMTEEHPKLLLGTYSVDRCAVSFATSAIWYLQTSKIDKAIERCDYVIDRILPIYDKKDVIGTAHILCNIIRVLKWNGHVDKAREAYTNFIPDGAENHFAFGCTHKPMSLLLRICDESSEEYNAENISEDIDMIMSSDVDDMTDFNCMADGWSMKSMIAEVCLHLARRLNAGDPAKESLIDRGILMATVASKRVKASNGMVKHIMAYEAHKDVHKNLLVLANEEVTAVRSIVYDESDRVSPSKYRTSDSLESGANSNSTLGFAERLNVKDYTSNTHGSTVSSNGSNSKLTEGSASSKPVHILTSDKKKVAFNDLSSFVSAEESAASKHFSNNSQEESALNTSSSANSPDAVSPLIPQ